MYDMDALGDMTHFSFDVAANGVITGDRAAIIKKVSGVDASTIKDMANKVTENVFKKTTYSRDNASSELFNTAIKLSKDPVDLNDLERQHKRIKQIYEGYIKVVKGERLINDSDRKDMVENVNNIRFESNVVNKLYSIRLKAARQRNSQAWKLITKWAAAGGKKVEPSYNVADNEPKNESGFMNIDII